MQRIYIFLFFTLFSYTTIFAADHHNIKGKVMDKDKTPIIGANIVWEGTSFGVVSNEAGEFSIHPIPDNEKLAISYIGYNTVVIPAKEGARLTIVLHDNIDLQEVEVSGRALGTVNSRTLPVQTQLISAPELCRAACCNLAESFETNASVDVTYSDAATGARQIRLLGLSGNYVQLLSEQTPSLRGAASTFGMGYIPGTWMESIGISKGISSVKNGYEAITGQINVEYKKPQTADPITLNLFVADNARVEANFDGALTFNKHLSAGLMLHYSNETQFLDHNKDGFSDLPMTEQFNVLNRWYYSNGNFGSQLFINAVHENRNSGQRNSIKDPFKIGITTDRGSFFSKNSYLTNRLHNNSIALIISGAYHNQRSYFGAKQYDVIQGNLYGNLLYEHNFSPLHKLTTGLSLNADRYDETLAPAIPNTLQHRTEIVPGAFAEYTLNIDEKWVVLAGIRADYNTLFGTFVTPRLHLKYMPNEHIVWRASAGKGYRTANVMIENSYLLASNRKFEISPNLDRQEEAWNMGTSIGFNLPIVGKNLNINLEYYFTNFNKQVVVDLDNNPHSTQIYNLGGKSFAQNAQIELSYPFFRGFTLTAAYRHTDARTTYNGVLREKPLTNRYKAMATASYQTPLKKWQFDLTGSFNGGGRLPDPDPHHPLWEKSFKPYTLLNAQITKYFRTWSIYLGGENLTGYTQKTPIIDAGNPWGENFDASMVYAPIHGAKFYIGARWNLSKD